jgi:hypothetical protein
MTKKLFVVLVVVSAMLISFSLVMAAKSVKHPADAQRFEYVKPPMSGTVQAVPTYTGPNKTTANYTQVLGAPTEILAGPVDRTKSLCDLTRAGYWLITQWIWGDEVYAHYEDPAAFGCTDIYPFRVTEVTFELNTYGAESFQAVASINGLDTTYPASPACPKPGTDICVSPVYNITIPAAGYYQITIPLTDLCCVYGPYFAEFYLIGALNTPDGVSDNAPLNCHTYNDWGSGWKDLVVQYGWPGCVQVYSKGLTMAHPPCPAPVPPPCRLQLEPAPAWRVSTFQPDGFVNFFDAAWCGAEDYPFRVDSILTRCTAAGVQFPITVKIGFYDLAGLDSCGGPGTELYSELVTFTGGGYQSIILSQPFCAHGPFYAGMFMASNDVGDTLWPNFSSDLLGPDTCKTYAFWGGFWYNWAEFWGYPTGIGHLLFRVIGSPGYLSCPELACTTATQTLADYISPAFVWALPSTSNRNYPNERFTIPMSMVAGARLDEVHFAWYNLLGDPNPTIYVWSDDGTGVPYDPSPPNFALASYNIPTANVVTFPSWQIQSTWQTGLSFNPLEEFHVGYSFVFDTGDKLDLLSDDYNDPLNLGDRASWYWPTGVWENVVTHFGMYMNFLVEAVICPNPPGESTFVMACAPPLGLASPGDVDMHVFDVSTAQIMNYNIPVTLTLLNVAPPVAITANFVPNGVAPPFISAVNLTVGPLVTYGDYVLTFQATGSDGQIKTCDVTVRIQPPYQEGVVNFFHGTQRTSNFGAIGNDAATDNFVWYGSNYLFDASFVSAVPSDSAHQAQHFALDVYNCEHVGFVPTGYMEFTHDSVCAGTPAQEKYGEIAYSNFMTHEDVISCEYDSLFVIGLSDVTSTDFSIKIKIYYNPTPTPIPLLHFGLFEDWDVGDAYNNYGAMDPQHNLMWQFDPLDPNLVFGMFKIPFYDEPMFNMWIVPNPAYVWPNAGFCAGAGLNWLYALMTTPGFGFATFPPGGPPPPAPPDTDYSLLMCPPPLTLNPGDKHIEIWIDFGRNLTDGLTWEMWCKKVMRYMGFFRGDVNASDSLELPSVDISDLVYLIDYLYQGGPAPQPFADQGDVDARRPYSDVPCDLDNDCPKENVDISDLVWLINYVYRNGPAPIDHVRFIPQCWTRPSMFLSPFNTW